MDQKMYKFLKFTVFIALSYIENVAINWFFVKLIKQTP